MMGTQIMFYFLSAVIVIFSLMAVTSLKVMRATIYLLFVLLATGGIYFLINYNFMGGVQLIVYAGGIVALIIFAVMLTHKIGEEIPAPSKFKMISGGLLSLTGAVITILIISGHQFNPAETDTGQDVKEIGRQLLNLGEGGYVLPFEVISILLLASMIAAIVVAKRKLTKHN
jgi:NADH-quinone oxidoreductase subunit J